MPKGAIGLMFDESHQFSLTALMETTPAILGWSVTSLMQGGNSETNNHPHSHGQHRVAN